MTTADDSQAEHEGWIAHHRREQLKGFYTHLGIFLAATLGLFLIDIASGPTWFFFYPAIVWGVAIAIHGVSIGVDRAFSSPPTGAGAEVGSRSAATLVGGNAMVIEQSSTLIDTMRSAARAIPKPEIRQQTLGLCASADLVLSVIEESPDEAELATDFLNRYLTPAAAIVTGYSRLANRNIPSAQATLEKVETHDLAVLAGKVDEIYDRLHRGTLIDLEVARDMLSLDVPDWEETLIGELATTTRRSEDK